MILPCLSRLRVAPFAAVVLVGCSTSSTGTVQPGTTKVLLTDAPFPYDQVSRVDIYIERIAASTQPDTGSNAGDTLQTGLQTIVSPRKAFNLLALSNGAVADLGGGALLAGQYVQVRLTIDTDSSSITLKDNTVLTGGNGIDWLGPSVFSVNVFTDPPIQVADSGAVVVIDFNLGRSFRPVDPANAAAGFQFIGYVTALNTALTGSLRGTVSGAGAGSIEGASVSLLVKNPAYPSDTSAWGVLGTGRTDAAGGFRMAYVRPDTGYVLLVEAPATSAYGAAARLVDVSLGTETQIGNIVVPLK